MEGIPSVNRLAERLHPGYMQLKIKSVKDETPSAKTFRLVPTGVTNELAYFRPGQYLSFSLNIEGASITRPYSIGSSPSDSLKGFYEITIKKSEGGFATSYIWDNWKEGTEVTSGGPQGNFYYDPLRDYKNITGIAGGCGITPFRSMMKSILEKTLDVNLTLFYGCNTMEDLIFADDFKRYEEQSEGKIKIIKVLASEKVEGCRSGFITSDIIKEYTDISKSSIFMCGPQGLYNFLKNELSSLKLQKKQVRRELFGEVKNVSHQEGYPGDKKDKTYRLKVHMGIDIKEIMASSEESLLVAMERGRLETSFIMQERCLRVLPFTPYNR